MQLSANEKFRLPKPLEQLKIDHKFCESIKLKRRHQLQSYRILRTSRSWRRDLLNWIGTQKAIKIIPFKKHIVERGTLDRYT
jgi:hypothetical protein